MAEILPFRSNKPEQAQTPEKRTSIEDAGTANAVAALNELLGNMDNIAQATDEGTTPSADVVALFNAKRAAMLSVEGAAQAA